MDVLKKLEEKLKLREVPEFFKHAESDPADILKGGPLSQERSPHHRAGHRVVEGAWASGDGRYAGVLQAA